MRLIKGWIPAVQKMIIVGIVMLGILFTFGSVIVDNNKTRLSLEEQQEVISRETYRSYREVKTENETEAAVLKGIAKVSCSLTGELCDPNRLSTEKDFHNSLFGRIATVYSYPISHPPASGIYYAATSLENMGLIPKAYAAQGIGFAGLSMFIDIWKQFRNISYMVLVLVVVAIGFMIMFKREANAQAAISMESALPKIVITMIMINFSFAIAGFLIDIMYVFLGMTLVLLAPFTNSGAAHFSGWTSDYITSNPAMIFDLVTGKMGFFGGIWNLFWRLPNSILNIMGVKMQILFRIIVTIGIFIIGFREAGELTKSIGKFITETLGGGAFKLLGFLGESVAGILAFILLIIIVLLIPNIVLFVIFFFTMISIAVRLLKMIFSAYLKILLLVIFSPFIILVGALPGRNTVVPWMLTILSELSIFPMIFIIFSIAITIMNIDATGTMLRLPFTWGLNELAFRFLLAMGLLFMMPALIDTFRKSIFKQDLGFPAIGPGVFFTGLSDASNLFKKFANFRSTRAAAAGRYVPHP